MFEELTELYCLVDDFILAYDAHFVAKYGKKPTRVPRIGHSGILTVILLYHQSGYKYFKTFYNNHVHELHCELSGNLPSYEQIVALLQKRYHISRHS